MGLTNDFGHHPLSLSPYSALSHRPAFLVWARLANLICSDSGDVTHLNETRCREKRDFPLPILLRPMNTITIAMESPAHNALTLETLDIFTLETTDQSARYRHPQYKRANESAAQRGQAITAKVDSLVRSINGSVHHAEPDTDWAFVTAGPSSDSNASDAPSSTAATVPAVHELTAMNIQLLDMMNDTSTVQERIWRRAHDDKDALKKSSLKKHRRGHAATRFSEADGELLPEPWGPAMAAWSYDLELNAVGAWAD